MRGGDLIGLMKIVSCRTTGNCPLLALFGLAVTDELNLDICFSSLAARVLFS